MITVNISKAKAISHNIRREARAQEFAPYDEVIMKQIPTSNLQEAEQARQAIRDKYAQIQNDIDAATSADELLEIITPLKGQ